MSKKGIKSGEELYQAAVDEWLSLNGAHMAVSDLIIKLGLIDEVGMGELVIKTLTQDAKDKLNGIKGLMDEKQKRIKYLAAEFSENK